MQSRWKRLLLCGVLSVSSGVLYAQSAVQFLQDFVAQVDQAEGGFTQRTVDAQGKQRPAQEGAFAFKRPGQFKWQVLQPYEQLVLSDGQQLFQYDPDLNQLTQRPVDEAVGASPAAILFGSGQLEQNFTLADRPDAEGLSWLRATPKANDAGFDYVDIGFADTAPAKLILLDAFGQQTLIELFDLNTTTALPSDTFRFTPPIACYANGLLCAPSGENAPTLFR